MKINRFLITFIAFLVLIISVILFIEKYEIVETYGFKEYLYNREINSYEEIISQFFEYLEYDYTPKYELNVKGKENISEIGVIYSVRDDSISSIKITFIVDNNTMDILEIRKSWKCRTGRGHWYWGAGKCY